MSKNPEDYGETIDGSRWFNGTPSITVATRFIVEEKWMCPIDDCEGEMVYNGEAWLTNPAGYHHTCSHCGFTAAIRQNYFPRQTTRA